jgi:hypothetical protein
MTGRLAPGAKLVEAIPGFVRNASPRVAYGWLSSSLGVSTVSGTNVGSGRIVKEVPGGGSSGAG